jgi:hypothetical protein
METNTTPRINAFLAELTAFMQATYANLHADLIAEQAADLPLVILPAVMEAGQRHIQAAKQAERNRDWNTMGAELRAFVTTLGQIAEVDTPEGP